MKTSKPATVQKLPRVTVKRRAVIFEGNYDRTVNDVYVDGKLWTAAVGDKLLPWILEGLPA